MQKFGSRVELLQDAGGIRVPAKAQPFFAEKAVFVIVPITVSPQIIVSWQVPASFIAVLESFAILSPCPYVYFECLFDLAVDGNPINNIRFSHLSGNNEKPPAFLKLFTENQAIQLRLFLRQSLCGETGASAGMSSALIGRLGGKYWSVN